MLQLSGQLSDRFGGARAFFCNSGTEAVEAALKWARKATGKPVVVALENSFHGRTHGALAVTGQPGKRAAWEPLAPAVRFANLNDIDSLAAASGPDTSVILIEPVQGEGGTHPATSEFLAAARSLADEHGALLVFDEVQCGVGRTGSFFAWEQLGVSRTPSCWRRAWRTACRSERSSSPTTRLRAWSPAITPVPSVAPGHLRGACAVVETLDDALLASVRLQGEKLAAGLAALPGSSKSVAAA